MRKYTNIFSIKHDTLNRIISTHHYIYYHIYLYDLMIQLIFQLLEVVFCPVEEEVKHDNDHCCQHDQSCLTTIISSLSSHFISQGFLKLRGENSDLLRWAANWKLPYKLELNSFHPGFYI